MVKKRRKMAKREKTGTIRGGESRNVASRERKKGRP